MMKVGRVREIWRYPIKSMQGESIARSELSELGILGDRGWALRDERTGEIRGGKKFPSLMACSARYLEEPKDDSICISEVTFPDGKKLNTNDGTIDAQLSAYLGREVTLHARRPATDLEHYRRTVPLTEEELRDVLARNPDEPLPDLSIVPQNIMQEISEFTSPRGTYFDAYPIHLLTTSWMAQLSAMNSDSRFEAPRFRPNIVIDEAPAGFAELNWCGKQLRIGEVLFNCAIPTIRCGMTTQSTADLPKDPQVLRTIVRDSEQNVGAYATVAELGSIKVGDIVSLL